MTFPSEHDFKRLSFAYLPAEAAMPVVRWYLHKLDLKLAETDARLVISDMKFGRSGLEINYDLIGFYSESLETEVDQEMEWVCRRATFGVK
jgi:hypothetical protein